MAEADNGDYDAASAAAPTPSSPRATAENGEDSSRAAASLAPLATASVVWSHARRMLLGPPPPASAAGDDESSRAEPVVRSHPSSNADSPAYSDAERDDKEEEEAKIDFLADRPADMTYGRRVALFLLRRYAWYNPRLKAAEPETEDESDGPAAAAAASAPERSALVRQEAYPLARTRRETPSLEKAWAYFEHVALNRYVVEQRDQNQKKQKKNVVHRAIRRLCCKGSQQLQRAEPGEATLPTALYKPLWTPHKQLGDFGLGIGLYFSTLRAITVMTLAAGLLNVPNFMYFSSSDYNSPAATAAAAEEGAVPKLLQGSAICTDVSWVPCPDCDPGDFEDARLAVGTSDLDPDANQTYFYLRNNCEGATLEQGLVNYATLLFIMLSTVALNLYLRQQEVTFDEDEQTAQDYSVVVENPPGDATDPDEWHAFFRDQFGAHVTACTVAVDNDLLVRSLVERREVLRHIGMKLPSGTSLDTLTLAGLAAKEERERRVGGRLLARVVPGIPEFFARLTVLTAKVQGLAQQDYPATHVFLTFLTEADQRRVLSTLNIGSLQAKRNRKNSMAPEHLFRGERVLSIREPDEPNTVRWQDLNEKLTDQMKQQLLTTGCTVAAIVLIALIVRILNGASLEASAFSIAIFNSLFPMFAKFLTTFEAHSSEGGKQRSLYFKIALFRWVNTAVVITIITPFTATLTNGELINQIYGLFVAEIITSNAIQLLDPVGHLQRHVLAPRAATQDSMNIYMQGQAFELAERYTNMTKILFLTVWYCAVYPGALFMCSFALLINYFTDRFSLMRTWKRAPQLGTKISQFSRRYFFSLATVAMAIISSYYWSGFPFDNLCPTDQSINYTSQWTIKPLSGPELELTLSEEDTIFKYCLQDFFRFDRGEPRFPFVPGFQPEGDEWMTDDQEIVTNIYGWSSIGVAGIVLISFVWGWYKGLRSLFRGAYMAVGDDQTISFSGVPSIHGYIPQVESPVFSFPLLACNIDGIDKGLLDWTDPDRPHSFYDLTKDADVLLRGTDVSSKVVFSQVRHWPPPAKKNQ